MGITKRSFSPDVFGEEGTPDLWAEAPLSPQPSELQLQPEEGAPCADNDDQALNALPLCLPGQLDIRVYCSGSERLTSKFATGFRYTSAKPSAMCECNEDGPEDLRWPLVKLAGQTDVRAFFKPAVHRNKVVAVKSGSQASTSVAAGNERSLQSMSADAGFCHSALAAEEEAAIAMGLTLGLEAEEWADESACDDYSMAREMEEAWSLAKECQFHDESTPACLAREEAAYTEDEASARAMGLSLAIEEDEERTFPAPATPPRREDAEMQTPVRRMKAGSAETQTPLHEAKRRRVGEESKSGAVVDKLRPHTEENAHQPLRVVDVC